MLTNLNRLLPVLPKLILATLAALPAAWAQPARGVAWALVTGGASPTVPAASQYNSAGGTITVARFQVGLYSLSIPNLGTSGGTAHTVAYNGNHYCNDLAWAPQGTTQVVQVQCYNAAGVEADGDVSVLFYKENRAVTTWSGGYVYANDPVAASYAPDAGYSWNSRGGINTMTRSGTGRYSATFPGLGPLPNLANVMVTGYQTSARCSPTFWNNVTDVQVNVACDSPAGVATDARFVVSLITDTAFGVNNGQEQLRGAFAWANDPTSASYVPNLRYQSNSAGAPIRARRTAVGDYQLDIPGLIPSNSANLQVSHYGTGGYCNVLRWEAGPLNGTTASVKCFSHAGAARDAQFLITYLTSQSATAALPAASAPNRAKAWVYSDGTGSNANPNALYQYNSGGGTNTITRYTTGRYRVDFPGLGTTSGIVHVNAFGGSAYCKANTWGPNGTVQEVWVMCFDSTGATVDSQFNVLFYKEERAGVSWNAGYARAHLPIVSAGYAPLSTYSWNGSGQPISVTRLGQGSYRATFGGFQQTNGGTVMVTPYGATDTRCRVSSWGITDVDVFCHQRDGTPIDSEFGISYATDVIFGADPAGAAHPGGFAWANVAGTASYQPSTSYRFNSSGGGFLATRSAAGAYQMDFTGLKPSNKTVPIITAYGPSPLTAHCRPSQLPASSGGTGTSISIGCIDSAGAGVDTRYTVVYLTTPQTPATLAVVSGSGQSAQVGAAFAQPLRAKVSDGDGNGIPGITVSFTPPPSGAGATLSSTTAVTDSSGTATVNATANSSAGAFTVTAVATGVSAVPFTLTNLAGNSTLPAFITPANNATITSTIVSFQWTVVPTATRYELRLIEAATPQQFRVEVLGSSSTNAIYTLPSGNYRAEVRACDNSGCSTPGITNFVLAGGSVPSAPPTGVQCTVANDNNQNRLNCAWTALTGAHFYFVNVVQPNTGPGGGALTVAGQQVGTNSISVLIPNGQATVLVRGCTGDGCGPFSAGVNIAPSIGNPTVPILGEPFAGSSVDAGSNAPQITFAWNRVAGDNGSNYRYRLYVQDFARNAPALDVLTTTNFFGAFFNPGTRYDALVIAIPINGGPAQQGPPSAFLTRGRVPRSPVATSPTYGSTVARDGNGQVTVAWTPLVNSDGTVSTRNYQYFFAGPTQVSGITTLTSLPLTLGPGNWQGTMRACTTGTSCTAGSETGWGPWNNQAGSEGGMAGFTVQ